jgi:hypothetical protein
MATSPIASCGRRTRTHTGACSATRISWDYERRRGWFVCSHPSPHPPCSGTFATERSCDGHVRWRGDPRISDRGLGPACNIPSWRTTISEDGTAAARSAKSRSFGCRPSPRDAANAPNSLEDVIFRAPVLAHIPVSLDHHSRAATPILALESTLPSGKSSRI